MNLVDNRTANQPGLEVEGGLDGTDKAHQGQFIKLADALTDPLPARSCPSGDVIVEVDAEPGPHGSQLQKMTR